MNFACLFSFKWKHHWAPVVFYQCQLHNDHKTRESLPHQGALTTPMFLCHPQITCAWWGSGSWVLGNIRPEVMDVAYLGDFSRALFGSFENFAEECRIPTVPSKFESWMQNNQQRQETSQTVLVLKIRNRTKLGICVQTGTLLRYFCNLNGRNDSSFISLQKPTTHPAPGKSSTGRTTVRRILVGFDPDLNVLPLESLLMNGEMGGWRWGLLALKSGIRIPIM